MTGGWGNFAVIWLLNFFPEFCGNFAEFCGIFAVCRNFEVTFLPGLRKICGQTEIVKKFLRSQHLNFYKSQKGENFSLHKSYILNLPKNADHFDVTLGAH